MKKTIFIGATAVALTLLTASCADDVSPFGKGAGCIAPTVGIDTEVNGQKAALSRAEAEGITVDDLSLKLSKDDGSSNPITWARISDFDVNKQFSVGNYTLEAFYGNPQTDQGFEKPAFYGSAKVIVADGRTSQVALTAAPANARFAVEYSEAFTNYMKAWSAEVSTGNGATTISSDETRPVYVAPGQVTFNVNVTKPNGQTANFEVARLEAKPAYHYVVKVDISGGASDAAINVTFDESLNQEQITIDISDEVVSHPAPELYADGFTPGTTFQTIEGLATENLKMNIMAMAGIESATLVTKSDWLLAQGWPQTVELVATPEADRVALEKSGLKVLGLWNNVGQMAVVDFTGVANALRAVSTGDNVSVFTLTVKDKIRRVTEPLELSVKVEAVELSLNVPDPAKPYYLPGEDLTMTVGFNGPDVEKNVKLDYKDSYGKWNALEVKSVAASRAATQYVITAVAPDMSTDLIVRATCAGTSAQDTFKRFPIEFETSEQDAFAKHVNAIVRVYADNATVADATILANGIPAKTTNNGNNVKIIDLTPDTDYVLKAMINGIETEPITIRTEAAPQLPNSGMEEWYSIIPDGNSEFQRLYYPGSSANTLWGTYNPLTTSQGENKKVFGLWTAPSSGYAASSGTMETTDAAVGSKAALIRTVTWGSSNTAAGSGSTCKHITQGELFIGKSAGVDIDPVYGMQFTSRPTSLRFKAKYISAPNSNDGDRGTAYIAIKDISGSIIAEKKIEIVPNSNYTDYTLELQYTKKVKAASIEVIFRSTEPDSQYLSKNYLHLENVKLGGYYHYGSQLYIDDIELIY